MKDPALGLGQKHPARFFALLRMTNSVLDDTGKEFLERYGQYGSYLVGSLFGERDHQSLFGIGEGYGAIAQELHALHLTVGVGRCQAQGLDGVGALFGPAHDGGKHCVVALYEAYVLGRVVVVLVESLCMERLGILC